MEDPEGDLEDIEDPEEVHKLQALRSLSVMIVLLKEYVANNLPQFMSVLAAGLKESTSWTLKMQALGTWRVFIRTLAEVSTKHKLTKKATSSSSSPLSRVAQQAVIVIMQSLEGGSDKKREEEGSGRSRRSVEVHSLAVRILEDIIIEHRDLVKG